MTDPVGFAFLWTGIVAAVSLIVVVLLAFLLAAPAGMLVARLFKRAQAPGPGQPA
jgi:hypothetical protein